MSALHVLVMGPMEGGACPVYRFGMHREALAGHGVELRSLTRSRVAAPASESGSDEEALASKDAVLDRSEIDWADVIVFRRFYASQWSCQDCALVSPLRQVVEAHGRAVGHRPSAPDYLVGPLFSAFERSPEVLRGRAVVYETDDDLLNLQSWNGVSKRVAPERGVIERMVSRADLVTVTTPILADRLRPLNDAIRVVRNAVDPSWYRLEEPAQPVDGGPRLLYYGSPTRMRDYAVCRAAVDEVVAAHPGARRVWLGAMGSPAGGSPAPVIAAVDEVGPYIEGPQAFSRALAAARPDIGLAPLVGDIFDQAKSELHWLEYTMAGAATIATRVPGGGPYDPIRDGVDGLLVSDRSEWDRALRRLVASRSLRDEVAGQARERVMREYTVAARAADWANAYRWAAEHAGRAVAGRVHALGELASAAVEAEACASLEHRQAARTAVAAAPARLAMARTGRVACWGPEDAVDPLVSVVIPVVDETDRLVRRAVRSALAGSHERVEVIVVRPAWDAHEGLGDPHALPQDPRVRLVPARRAGKMPPAGTAMARAATSGLLLRAGLAAARGQWIAPLSPEGEFEFDHIEVLLGVALEHQVEFVYGQALIDAGRSVGVLIGSWPPNADEVLTLSTELFARQLVAVADVDPDAWREGATPGWALWRAFIESGVRMAGIEHVVTRLAQAVASDGLDPALVSAASPMSGAADPTRSERAADGDRKGYRGVRGGGGFRAKDRARHHGTSRPRSGR